MNDKIATQTLDGLDADYEAHRTIAASPDVVFDALTTTEGLSGWWTRATGSGQPGGELRFSFGPDAYADMRVDAAERSVGVIWTVLACHVEDWVGTTVQFSLEALPSGDTELRFRHAGLTPRLECFSDCKSGWDHFVPSLAAYAETGVGNPNGSAADTARREARDAARAG